jgi:hypothetical protein
MQPRRAGVVTAAGLAALPSSRCGFLPLGDAVLDERRKNSKSIRGQLLAARARPRTICHWDLVDSRACPKQLGGKVGLDRESTLAQVQAIALLPTTYQKLYAERDWKPRMPNNTCSSSRSASIKTESSVIAGDPATILPEPHVRFVQPVDSAV